jgi:hypothetical protein
MMKGFGFTKMHGFTYEHLMPTFKLNINLKKQEMESTLSF